MGWTLQSKDKKMPNCFKMDLVTEILLKQETQKTWNKRMGKICYANTNKGKDDEATLMSYKWHACGDIKKSLYIDEVSIHQEDIIIPNLHVPHNKA